MRIQVKLSGATLKRNALIAQGIDPAAFGQRRGSRVHRDKRAAERAGQHKHKHRSGEL